MFKKGKTRNVSVTRDSQGRIYFFKLTVSDTSRQPSDITKSFLKYSIVGWGIPAVLAVGCAVLDSTGIFHIGYGLFPSCILVVAIIFCLSIYLYMYIYTGAPSLDKRKEKIQRKSIQKVVH